MKRGAALRAASAAGGAVGRPISYAAQPSWSCLLFQTQRFSHRAGSSCNQLRGWPAHRQALCASTQLGTHNSRSDTADWRKKSSLNFSETEPGPEFPTGDASGESKQLKKNGLPRASSRPQICAVPALARPSHGANCSQELLRFPVHNLDRMSCRPISLRR